MPEAVIDRIGDLTRFNVTEVSELAHVASPVSLEAEVSQCFDVLWHGMATDRVCFGPGGP